jgi:hypothetical protein
VKPPVYLAALERERAGYEAKGRPERAKAVTEEIARFKRSVTGPREKAVSPAPERT